jgi:hypothetical protein
MRRRRSSIRDGRLLEFAAHRLVELFPNTAIAARAVLILRELNPPADRILPTSAKTEPAATVSNARCREKGCVFPSMAGHGLCRGHIVDSRAEFSMTPSYAGEMIGPLHFHARAS